MSRKITTKEFQNRLNDIYGDRFEVLSEYVNNETKIKLRCNKCNSIIYKRPAKMTGSSREGCYVCSGKNKHKTTESFTQEVECKYPGGYRILGKYECARSVMRVQNLKCGHEYNISPDNLLRGKGCPKCSIRQSSYMDMVENILQRNNIEFIKEKTFDECKQERKLPFDYYLPKYNCCIEVDGEFHYDRGYICFDNKNSLIEAVQLRDKIKTDFCKKQNILLIRLPYFEKEYFEEIIIKTLQANTEITAGNKKLAAL